MKIKRTLYVEIAGSSVAIPTEIKLTPRELRHAYEEQQHNYDLDDIDNELEVSAEWYNEDYNISKKPVTAEERERMAQELRRILENDPDCTESQCRSEAVANILKTRSADDDSTADENSEPRTYIVTETCPNCECDIEMVWNTDVLGFQAVCPVCGGRLMLCDECRHCGEPCDYDSAADKCHMQKKVKSQISVEVTKVETV